jgi:hypothetical protein
MFDETVLQIMFLGVKKCFSVGYRFPTVRMFFFLFVHVFSPPDLVFVTKQTTTNEKSLFSNRLKRLKIILFYFGTIFSQQINVPVGTVKLKKWSVSNQLRKRSEKTNLQMDAL